jgi:hypothetical protein
MARRNALRFVALLTVAASSAAHGGAFDKFLDSSDGAFDLSDYLLRHRGVLPIPLVITEPAVGYGAGAALAYFSQSFEQRAEESKRLGKPVTPPDISLGAALATENGTWMAAAAHMGFWDEDRLRYIGGVAKAELHLDYYSASGTPRAYQMDAGAIIQQLVRRVGTTHWFAGARYMYIATESRFDAGRPEDVPTRSLDTSIGKLGLVLDYDTRDNIFTPSKGTFFEMEAAFARGTFGSDSRYETLYARAFSWHPAGAYVFGVRGDVRLSRGDVPFYMQPYVVLRGVPAVRYQDRNAVVAEGEVRWNIDSRWALVGFAGAGKAYGRRQSWDEAKNVFAGGVGFRYLVARKLGMYAGLDVARGPEESAFYITAGSSWR